MEGLEMICFQIISNVGICQKQLCGSNPEGEIRRL